MFVYHRTNGDNGEILVEMFGNFLGFIVNFGRPDQWAAYTRELEPGDGGSAELMPRHGEEELTKKLKKLQRLVALSEEADKGRKEREQREQADEGRMERRRREEAAKD